jgi:hypothetical protein
MKLTSALMLDQPLTQCLARRDHQGEGLRPPFLDARLHAIRAGGIDDQRLSRHPGARRAEPPQGIEDADALDANMARTSLTLVGS